MAGSLNKVMLIGNMGQDPEIRQTQSGNRIANLSLATSESWKDKQTGERREQTEWHRVVIFNETLVGVVERYTAKGTKLYVEGQIKTRKWKDQSGADRYSTEIVLQGFNASLTILSGGRSDGDGQRAGGGQQSGGYGQSSQQRGPSPVDDLDDEIPF